MDQATRNEIRAIVREELGSIVAEQSTSATVQAELTNRIEKYRIDFERICSVINQRVDESSQQSQVQG